MKRYIKSAVVPLYQYDKDVLRRIARDPHTSLEDLKSLAEYPDDAIQYFVSKNPTAAEWFSQRPKRWEFCLNDLEYGVVICYTNSAYDGTNPEVITDLVQKTLTDMGLECLGCWVNNLPHRYTCSSGVIVEGNHGALVDVKFDTPTCYGAEVCDRIEQALEAIGCSIVYCDYFN